MTVEPNAPLVVLLLFRNSAHYAILLMPYRNMCSTVFLGTTLFLPLLLFFALNAISFVLCLCCCCKSEEFQDEEDIIVSVGSLEIQDYLEELGHEEVQATPPTLLHLHSFNTSFSFRGIRQRERYSVQPVPEFKRAQFGDVRCSLQERDLRVELCSVCL